MKSGKTRNSPQAALPPAWYRPTKDGDTVLFVLVQPNAKRTEVIGEQGGLLKIRIASPPVDGSANAELIRFLAEKLQIKERRLSLLKGATSRKKSLLIHGVTDGLESLLVKP